VILQISWSTSS